VTASGSKGTAEELGCVEGTEDTITLMVDWVNELPGKEGKVATGVYTASWTAPQKAGVHSNQYFHCMDTPRKLLTTKEKEKDKEKKNKWSP